MATASEAGMLGAFSEGRRHVGAEGALPSGARIAICAGAVDRHAWARILRDAGAQARGDGPCPARATDWADVDLVVVAADGGPLDALLAEGAPPFIVVGEVAPAELSRLLRAGMMDVLARPVGPAGLVDACAAALARAPARPIRDATRARDLPVEGAIGAAVARTRLPVLIVGETGTGKSRLARMMHETLTPGAPFVEVNAAALAGSLLTSELFGHERGAFTGAHVAKPGLVAMADGGTLFLDEIGELAPEAQAQLLSYLDTGEYRPVGGVRQARSDARIFCATNRDLRAAMASGSFREDLYYRLASILIPLSPLREHRDRIVPLARELVRQAAARAQVPAPELDPEVGALLARFDWPGNVRQLRFLIERAVALSAGARIGAAELVHLLDDERRRAPTEPEPGLRSLAEMERDMVARAMRAAGGNRTKAAEMLGITPRGLYNKLRRSGTSFQRAE